MEQEQGDDYIRRISSFIHKNEHNLAESRFFRRRKANSLPTTSVLNPLGWIGLGDNTPNPVTLSVDTHHLFYLLVRLEALGIDVGSLDVQIENPSRPMSYLNIKLDGSQDKAETYSIASFRSSLSAVSKLSLGSSWWSRADYLNIDADLKYVFSSFTKLPSLAIGAPGVKIIAEQAADPPDHNAVPLYAFKNLQSLELSDVDPRALLGWDHLAISLRSLTITRSGLEDPSCIFVDAVLEDQARRDGSMRSRIRKIGSCTFRGTQLPERVQEELEDDDSGPEGSVHAVDLPALNWAFLKHLSLSDNSMTSLPSTFLTHLTSLTHLDLSSNLLVSVPAGLSALYNLVYLNLSDNMIDSVLGIYTKLGQVLSLNLASNRLDSLCGLERLLALERVDLRFNSLVDTAEVGRLAQLPNVAEVWIDGNPFVKTEEGHRVKCFEYFRKEGKTIALDGSLPGFYEKRHFTSPILDSTLSRPQSTVLPPHYNVSVIQGSSAESPKAGPSNPTSVLGHSPAPSATSSPTPKPRKRKVKRVVDLDGNGLSEDGQFIHPRIISTANDASSARSAKSKSKSPGRNTTLDATQKYPSATTQVKSDLRTEFSSTPRTMRKSRHSRYVTELPSPTRESPPSSDPRSRPSIPEFNPRSSLRRLRQSASVHEPPLDHDNHLASECTEEHNHMKDADAFRAKIEALRSEVGDSWLHVLNQSQFSPRQAAKR